MTKAEAMKEAKTRWGPTAMVTLGEPVQTPFEVGSVQNGWLDVKGQGASWEAAFANADAKKAKHAKKVL